MDTRQAATGTLSACPRIPPRVLAWRDCIPPRQPRRIASTAAVRTVEGRVQHCFRHRRQAVALHVPRPEFVTKMRDGARYLIDIEHPAILDQEVDTDDLPGAEPRHHVDGKIIEHATVEHQVSADKNRRQRTE